MANIIISDLEQSNYINDVDSNEIYYIRGGFAGAIYLGIFAVGALIGFFTR